MSVVTPQRNPTVDPKYAKHIVFLKVPFTKHQFLRVVEMLGWVTSRELVLGFTTPASA
jgi:hypothetical protein